MSSREIQDEIDLEDAFLESEKECDYSRLTPYEHALLVGNRRHAFRLGHALAMEKIQELVNVLEDVISKQPVDSKGYPDYFVEEWKKVLQKFKREQ